MALLTVANLRGVKEASTLFALPTYLFVATVGTMLVVGFAKCLDGVCPTAISSGADLEAEVAVIGLFLILRAFASGSTALTGVEAVANGRDSVPARRNRKRRHHARDHGCHLDRDVPRHLNAGPLVRRPDLGGNHRPIRDGNLADGRAVFDGGVGFYHSQVFTAAILILAANTAYRTSLAYPPSWPNTSWCLASTSTAATASSSPTGHHPGAGGPGASDRVPGGSEPSDPAVRRGRFTAFTLSQTGMVLHWLKVRDRGWRRSVAINAVAHSPPGWSDVVTTASSSPMERGS